MSTLPLAAAAPSIVVAQGNGFAQIASDGSMLLAIPVAILAGLVAFLSPCVLPLVPGYLGYVTGLTGADLAEQRRGRMVAGVSLFIAGFTAVFVLVGVLFGRAFLWLRGDGAWLTQVLGVVVILMGVVFMGGFRFMQRDARIHKRPPAGLWGAPVLGVTFALGWAPCMGPTLAAVMALATGPGGGAARGAVLSLAYCVGLGLPFVLVAMGLRKATGALAFFRRHQLAVMRVGGAMLIVLGLLMASGLWGHWSAQLQDWFQNEVRLPI